MPDGALYWYGWGNISFTGNGVRIYGGGAPELGPGTITQNTNTISLAARAGACATLFTTPLDMTNKSNIKVLTDIVLGYTAYTQYYSRIGVPSAIVNDFTMNPIQTYSANATGTTCSLDVSGLTGSKYLGLYSVGGSYTVYSIIAT